MFYTKKAELAKLAKIGLGEVQSASGDVPRSSGHVQMASEEVRDAPERSRGSCKRRPESSKRRPSCSKRHLECCGERQRPHHSSGDVQQVPIAAQQASGDVQQAPEHFLEAPADVHSAAGEPQETSRKRPGDVKGASRKRPVSFGRCPQSHARCLIASESIQSTPGVSQVQRRPGSLRRRPESWKP